MAPSFDSVPCSRKVIVARLLRADVLGLLLPGDERGAARRPASPRQDADDRPRLARRRDGLYRLSNPCGEPQFGHTGGTPGYVTLAGCTRDGAPPVRRRLDRREHR